MARNNPEHACSAGHLAADGRLAGISLERLPERSQLWRVHGNLPGQLPEAIALMAISGYRTQSERSTEPGSPFLTFSMHRICTRQVTRHIRNMLPEAQGALTGSRSCHGIKPKMYNSWWCICGRRLSMLFMQKYDLVC